jgi:hypothetical protein
MRTRLRELVRVYDQLLVLLLTAVRVFVLSQARVTTKDGLKVSLSPSLPSSHSPAPQQAQKAHATRTDRPEALSQDPCATLNCPTPRSSFLVSSVSSKQGPPSLPSAAR